MNRLVLNLYLKWIRTVFFSLRNDLAKVKEMVKNKTSKEVFWLQKYYKL